MTEKPLFGYAPAHDHELRNDLPLITSESARFTFYLAQHRRRKHERA